MIALVLVAGCAKEGVPPGGPEDIEPPLVAGMAPESGTIGVGLGETIAFRFSERMDRRSVERALFFTPDIRNILRPLWQGNELRLIPRAPLRENTTYVITLGADATDARRNRLGRSVTLAFSTGETLDNASVSGLVLEDGRGVEGAWIWIYPVGTDAEQEQADPLLASAEPAEQVLPLYVAQTDNSGRFEARYLAAESYRAFAFRDTDNDRYYDPERDLLAVPPSDLRFEETEERIDRLHFTLAPRDTTGPSIRLASAPDPRIVRIRLSEPLAPGALPRVEIETYDAASPESDEAATAGAPLRVLEGYVSAASPSTVVYRTERMTPGRRYRVRLAEAFDALGNPAVEATRPITFSTPAEEDTTRPELESIAPADSTRTFNRDIRIRLVFTTEIDSTGLDAWMAIGPDTVALSRHWIDPRTVELRALSDPTPDGWYDLQLREGSLHSWTGLTGPARGDTLSWQGSRLPGRGRLRVKVNADTATSPVEYQIIIEGVGSATEPRTVITTSAPGEVITPPLPEGPYLIWGFADANLNGQLDVGRVRPFEPAERVATIVDTQYVRDTFESIVGAPLELGGIRHLTPVSAASDTGRAPPVPPPIPPSQR